MIVETRSFSFKNDDDDDDDGDGDLRNVNRPSFSIQCSMATETHPPRKQN